MTNFSSSHTFCFQASWDWRENERILPLRRLWSADLWSVCDSNLMILVAPTDDDEPVEYIDQIETMSNILENCKNYSSCEMNKICFTKSNNKCNQFSTYFTNIDGNQSNFDTLSIELKKLNRNFSVIGLAETNTDPCNKELYKLSDYSSCYQDRMEGKQKGSGVALYIHNDFNYTTLPMLSKCTPNLESLFVSITNANVQDTVTVGVIYRPPSGKKSHFLNEMEDILNQIPKEHVFIPDLDQLAFMSCIYL